MSKVGQLVPSMDPTRALQLAEEARKADGAIVTAEVMGIPGLARQRMWVSSVAATP